jgi:integrase
VRTVKERGLYADGKGLYLRIGPTGAKSWIYRYRSDGRRHDLGLGSYPDVSLADARERATEQRKLRVNGQDPLFTRHAERDQARIAVASTMTFQACGDAYIAAHRAGWRSNKHLTQWQGSLAAYVYPVFGDLPVKAVDVGLVMKVLEPIWTTKPESASRTRGRIESILDWATARGYRAGENPARWRGHLENLLPARRKIRRVQHHPALPYSEIAGFMANLRQRDGIAAHAMQFLILTAARTTEVIGAHWDEIDMGGRVWIIPADRMKGGREHRVPLSSPAIALLEQMAAVQVSKFVFPGRVAERPLFSQMLLKLLSRMGRNDLTTHGFRTTFRDWVAECTRFPAEVAEMALAHAVSNKVEAAYRRGDLFEKRRQLADAWSRYCTATAADRGLVVPTRIGAVVPDQLKDQ